MAQAMDSSNRATLGVVAGVIAGVFAFVLILMLTGCSRTDGKPVAEEPERRIVAVEREELEALRRTMCVLEDAQTGVQYIALFGDYGSVAVTPLLDSNGRPYVARHDYDQGAEADMPRRGARTETVEAADDSRK